MLAAMAACSVPCSPDTARKSGDYGHWMLLQFLLKRDARKRPGGSTSNGSPNWPLVAMALPTQRAAVQFTAARPAAGTARLPDNILDDRKRDAQERWEFMKDYLHTEGCRAQFLEALFDQEIAAPCGICDRCSLLNLLLKATLKRGLETASLH